MVMEKDKIVDMLKGFISLIDSTENIYDIIACCCDYIFPVIQNEEQFISMYYDEIPTPSPDGVESGEGNRNPNHEQLNNLRHSIQSRLMEMPIITLIDQGKEHPDFKSFKGFLAQLLAEIILQDYYDPVYNQATIPYVVLHTIDRFIPSLPDRHKPKSGPLGKTYERYNTLVYPAADNTIISVASIKSEFRHKVHTSKIRECVTSVRLVQREQLLRGAGIPKIIGLDIEKDESLLKTINDRKISLAFIPYSIHREFDFCQFAGSAYIIKYNHSDKDIMKERCKILLERAIMAKANIIAFPEYIVSETMLNEIKHFLLQKNRSDLDSLIMVIAGSKWDEKSNNNVLCILDKYGNEVGKYYKYSPYTRQMEYGHNVFDLCECLSTPGHECTVINVNGIGHILPAICRDVIDAYYTDTLAEFFHPALVIAPAWSKSLRPFYSRIKSYANKFHTSSFILNSCHANGRKPSTFACACFPKKEEREIQGEITKMRSSSNCIKNCDSNGCVFLIKVDYSVDSEFDPQIRSVWKPKIRCEQI